MQISENADRYMHDKLPIGKEEKILAIFKHHWFAYASIWIFGIALCAILLATAIGVTSLGDPASGLADNKGAIISGTVVFCIIVLAFTLVPIWLRSQEQVVLTEEALLQILQPSIFASKVSQLNLSHLADVSVRQQFFGTILGFGKVTVETPGEQDNYEFFMIPNPHKAAKEIIEAHENYEAALQAGRIKTTIGQEPVAAAPQIDMAEYQKFLAYQQAMNASQGAAAASQPSVTDPQATPQSATTPTDQPVQSSQQPTPFSQSAQDDQPTDQNRQQ